jgi:hypothetical protein
VSLFFAKATAMSLFRMTAEVSVAQASSTAAIVNPLKLHNTEIFGRDNTYWHILAQGHPMPCPILDQHIRKSE